MVLSNSWRVVPLSISCSLVMLDDFSFIYFPSITYICLTSILIIQVILVLLVCKIISQDSTPSIPIQSVIGIVSYGGDMLTSKLDWGVVIFSQPTVKKTSNMIDNIFFIGVAYFGLIRSRRVVLTSHRIARLIILKIIRMISESRRLVETEAIMKPTNMTNIIPIITFLCRSFWRKEIFVLLQGFNSSSLFSFVIVT